MIRFFLFTSLIFIMACGGNGSEKPSADDENASFWTNPPLDLDSLRSGKPLVNVLSGIIDSVPVEMQIVINPNFTVRGSYFYTEYKTLLPFQGRIFNDGRVNLAVYDIHLEEAEQFKGKVDENWQFRGNWLKVEAGAEKMDFSFEQKRTPSLIADLEGTYKHETADYTQTLAIRKVSKHQFEFQMMLSSGFCTGEIEEGIAYFHSGTDANFYGNEGCYINFEIDKKTIKVGETDCTFYHGMRCVFDGAYQKTTNQVEWITDFYATDEELDSLLDL